MPPLDVCFIGGCCSDVGNHAPISNKNNNNPENYRVGRQDY
jgi:hypothetical protein